jgi:hypothetical protein
MEVVLMRRLPLILGVAAGGAVLLLFGPIAVAVVLLRSSNDAVGPGLSVQLFIAVFVLSVSAAAGLATAWLVRLLLRLLRRNGR